MHSEQVELSMWGLVESTRKRERERIRMGTGRSRVWGLLEGLGMRKLWKSRSKKKSRYKLAGSSSFEAGRRGGGEKESNACVATQLWSQIDRKDDRLLVALMCCCGARYAMGVN